MYLEVGKAAFDEYRKLCENIDCDYEIKDNLVYSLDDEKKLEKEMDALLKIGFNADFSTDLPLPIKTAGAVRFSNQAQFNPLKFLFHIAKGLNTYENTFVREINQNTAITNRGKITAEKIIITTHFPFINRHGSYFLKLYQHRSYVLALENAKNFNGMYVDEDDKGLSFRNYGNITLLGGGGHRTGKDGGGMPQPYPSPRTLYGRYSHRHVGKVLFQHRQQPAAGDSGCRIWRLLRQRACGMDAACPGEGSHPGCRFLRHSSGTAGNPEGLEKKRPFFNTAGSGCRAPD
jgi:glycine/D-amino acid oxidase-like deaminating enzyme